MKVGLDCVWLARLLIVSVEATVVVVVVVVVCGRCIFEINYTCLTFFRGRHLWRMITMVQDKIDGRFRGNRLKI